MFFPICSIIEAGMFLGETGGARNCARHSRHIEREASEPFAHSGRNATKRSGEKNFPINSDRPSRLLPVRRRRIRKRVAAAHIAGTAAAALPKNFFSRVRQYYTFCSCDRGGGGGDGGTNFHRSGGISGRACGGRAIRQRRRRRMVQ